MASSFLEKTLLKLARFFEHRRIAYMVIGGVANLFWGIPRTTLDIDVTIQVNETAILPLVGALKKSGFQSRVRHPLDFVRRTHVLPLEDQKGIRVDLIFAKLPYEEEAIRRAKRKRIKGGNVRLCTPEDLILHKIVSDRPQDHEDIRGIIERLGVRLNRKYLDPYVKDLAGALVRPGMLRFYLDCFK